MNIVFTGFMASGKTTVGNRLAEILDIDFLDCDLEIERECKMKIPEIFAEHGEEYFRDKETYVIKNISDRKNCVISTGGGAVLRSENVDALRKNGCIVNLETNPEIIEKRLGGGDANRPLTSGKSLSETIERFNERKPFYDNCDVKIVLDAQKSVEETVEEILKILEEKYESKIWSGRKQ